MKHKIIFSILFSSSILFFSCTKKVGKSPKATPVQPTPVVVVVNKCDTITFAKHIKPILDVECVYCHKENFSSGNFKLYDVVKDKGVIGTLKSKVNDGSMPQGGPKLPQAKIDLIECWISNGYKQ